MSDTADTMRLPISDQHRHELRRLALLIGREPFRGRAWGELAFFVVSCAWAYAWVIALGFVGLIGALLTIVFVGLLIVAGGLRAARAVGRSQRALAEVMIGEAIPSPDPFSAPPGFLPWLRAALLDTTAWRTVLYLIAKVPLGLFGAWFALSIWLTRSPACSPQSSGTGYITWAGGESWELCSALTTVDKCRRRCANISARFCSGGSCCCWRRGRCDW